MQIYSCKKSQKRHHKNKMIANAYLKKSQPSFNILEVFKTFLKSLFDYSDPLKFWHFIQQLVPLTSIFHLHSVINLKIKSIYRFLFVVSGFVGKLHKCLIFTFKDCSSKKDNTKPTGRKKNKHSRKYSMYLLVILHSWLLLCF